MKRSHRFSTFLTVVTALMATATPALAQDYYVDDSIGMGLLCCYGIAGLLALVFFVFWVWMIIDVFQRQEYEFPGSTGNSKTIWLVIMFVSWFFSLGGIAAIVYYFMVYKKVKRGTMPPPSAGGMTPPPGSPGIAPPPPAAGAGTPPAPPAGAGTPPPPAPGGDSPPPPPPAGQ